MKWAFDRITFCAWIIGSVAGAIVFQVFHDLLDYALFLVFTLIIAAVLAVLFGTAEKHVFGERE